jgi:hypothetical protein
LIVSETLSIAQTYQKMVHLNQNTGFQSNNKIESHIAAFS